MLSLIAVMSQGVFAQTVEYDEWGNEITVEKKKLSEEEMMARWQETMVPGEEHKELAMMAGKFKSVSKHWMSPEGEPQEEIGTCTNEMILDGRFVRQHMVGKFGEMPFEGFGTIGFDRLENRFVLTWMDNFGTGMMTGSGSHDGDDIFIECTYPSVDRPGETETYMMIYTIHDKDHHSMEMHTYYPDGGSWKTMEVEYTRIK